MCYAWYAWGGSASQASPLGSQRVLSTAQHSLVQVGCIFAELLGMQYRVDSEGAGGGLSASVWFRFGRSRMNGDCVGRVGHAASSVIVVPPPPPRL